MDTSGWPTRHSLPFWSPSFSLSDSLFTKHLRLNFHKVSTGKEWAGLSSSYISYLIFINWDWVCVCVCVCIYIYIYICLGSLTAINSFFRRGFTGEGRGQCVCEKVKAWAWTSKQKISSLGNLLPPTGSPNAVLCWEWLFILEILQWHHNIESCAIFRFLRNLVLKGIRSCLCFFFYCGYLICKMPG